MESSRSIFDVLKADHREVKNLMKEILHADFQNPARMVAFRKLRHELLTHSHNESAIFYDRLRELLEDRSLIFEADEEHHIVEILLDELKEASLSDEQWMAKMTVLQEAVLHHIEEEEGAIFRDAKKVLGKYELDQMGAEMLARKQDAHHQAA